ncbi:alpha/beta fold hydrolase [Planktotalea sp.]|uniref:alpha/beta hydrolase n=1 Tax=Planktotalea sp. TaxID=2029877 RepID=UPI00329A0B10
MRLILLILTLIAPLPLQAGLLDLLPLKRIERKMLYPLSASEVDPSAIGLQRAEVHRFDQGSYELVVWTLKAQRASAPTVLYFHGNAGNLATRAQRFATMQGQGFNVIAMSYPGSSGSGGLPSEETITNDALAVYKSVGQLIDGRTSQDVILMGESLGCAVAIALLTQLDPDERPSGIILEAPFTSTPDMARAVTDVPDNLVERIQDRWENLARAGALTIPLLVIHGSVDEVTPPRMGRAIFNAAPVKDKDFLLVPNATHSGTWRSDTMPRLWRFIRAYGAN